MHPRSGCCCLQLLGCPNHHRCGPTRTENRAAPPRQCPWGQARRRPANQADSASAHRYEKEYTKGHNETGALINLHHWRALHKLVQLAPGCRRPRCWETPWSCRGQQTAPHSSERSGHDAYKASFNHGKYFSSTIGAQRSTASTQRQQQAM
jgi:hypothetical protein